MFLRHIADFQHYQTFLTSYDHGLLRSALHFRKCLRLCAALSLTHKLPGNSKKFRAVMSKLGKTASEGLPNLLFDPKLNLARACVQSSRRLKRCLLRHSRACRFTASTCKVTPHATTRALFAHSARVLRRAEYSTSLGSDESNFVSSEVRSRCKCCLVPRLSSWIPDDCAEARDCACAGAAATGVSVPARCRVSWNSARAGDWIAV